MPNHTTTKEPVQQVFASHGLRCTRQRRFLYQALSATRTHPTADELHHSLNGQMKDVSLATVYNTLEAFCEAGLAQKLPNNGGSARYDAATHNHLHMRDQNTGTVADAPDGLSQRLLDKLPAEVLRQLEQQAGFKIHQVQIELIGRFA